MADYFDKLNDKFHTYVIAEAGSNWKNGSYDEDLQQAKKLINIAKESGADAVKFQTFKPESIYVSNAGHSKYLSDHGIEKNINDIFENLSMPYEMLPELRNYCDKQKIDFMSTPFSVEDAKEIEPLVKIHKVASYEINHVRLLEYLTKSEKPIIISTGATGLEEIEFAVNVLKKNGHQEYSLMQCTAKYPSPIDKMNLQVIPMLKSKFNIPIGLSDHSTNPIIAPLMAIGLGATIIEKHFTIDKNLDGPDHKFSLEPYELELMIKSIREADKTKGSGIKEILDVEKELKQFATRSLQAIADIAEGEILEEGKNFDILRPGNRIRGLDSRFLEEVNGKKAKKNISKGDGITDYYQ